MGLQTFRYWRDIPSYFGGLCNRRGHCLDVALATAAALVSGALGIVAAVPGSIFGAVSEPRCRVGGTDYPGGHALVVPGP
ncbi:hypothetical protein D3C77_357130 [compost metagenome]